MRWRVGDVAESCRCTVQRPYDKGVKVAESRLAEVRRARTPVGHVDDVVTALLTASRVLVAVSAGSLADFEETVTLTQDRKSVV